MTSQNKLYLPEKLEKIDKLKSLLLRSGNKERTNTFLIDLLQILKLSARLKINHPLISFTSRFPLNTLGEKNPTKILDQCLYKLMPAFILRRTFVAGKLFNLPVPISPNRARFVAADWLRQAAFKDNKNAFTVPYLLTREIGAVFHKQGSAYASLTQHIDIALDQRPFSRYIRRRRNIISRSKRGRAAKRLMKRFRKNLRIKRKKTGLSRSRAKKRVIKKSRRR